VSQAGGPVRGRARAGVTRYGGGFRRRWRGPRPVWASGRPPVDDDDARSALTEVKGVGRFTADGVLMLALRRPDVWPAADLALRRAVERVWRLDPPASVQQVDELGERFRPWRTLAAAYLYSSVEP
jgi:endonuclease III